MLQLLAHFGARKLLELDEITGRKTGESGGADQRTELECAKYFKATNSTSKALFTFDTRDLVQFGALMKSPTHLTARHMLNICLKSIHAVYIVVK